MRCTDQQKASSYITKSKEFLETTKLAVQHANYNSAVTSAISALDALATSYMFVREPDHVRDIPRTIPQDTSPHTDPITLQDSAYRLHFRKSIYYTQKH